MKKNDVPGVSVQIYDHGKAQAYYLGVADRTTQKPITANTIFEIGSLTKLMTSLLLAQQVEQHHINLNDSISNPFV